MNKAPQTASLEGKQSENISSYHYLVSLCFHMSKKVCTLHFGAASSYQNKDKDWHNMSLMLKSI